MASKEIVSNKWTQVKEDYLVMMSVDQSWYLMGSQFADHFGYRIILKGLQKYFVGWFIIILNDTKKRSEVHTCKGLQKYIVFVCLLFLLNDTKKRSEVHTCKGLQNFTEFHGILENFTEFYRILQNFTEFYKSLENFTEFYRILQNFREFHRILQNFTEF